MILLRVEFACDFCSGGTFLESERPLGAPPLDVQLPAGWSITHNLLVCPRHRVLVHDIAGEPLLSIPASPRRAK